MPWHVVVFDEVHQIKNPQSKTYQACSRLKCKLRYGLSGTIMPVRSFSCLGWQVPLSSLWGVECIFSTPCSPVEQCLSSSTRRQSAPGQRNATQASGC